MARIGDPCLLTCSTSAPELVGAPVSCPLPCNLPPADHPTQIMMMMMMIVAAPRVISADDSCPLLTDFFHKSPSTQATSDSKPNAEASGLIGKPDLPPSYYNFMPFDPFPWERTLFPILVLTLITIRHRVAHASRLGNSRCTSTESNSLPFPCALR